MPAACKDLSETEAGNLARAVSVLVRRHGGRKRAAAILQVNRETLRRLRLGHLGRRHPQTLARLAQAVGCSVEQLLDGSYQLAACELPRVRAMLPTAALEQRCAA
jgi:hypothetical protein